MQNEIWALLGLQRASLSDLDSGADDDERQPPPYKLAFPQLGSKVVGADEWRGQEPAERLVNTILLCAIRDGASLISIEPQIQSVRVRYTVAGNVRDHLKLPTLVLQPIVARFKCLAQLDEMKNAAQMGLIRLRVDERFYDLHLSTEPTQWGERVELRLTSPL